MNKIKRALLTTNNLKHLFETHWYKQIVDEVVSTQIQEELYFEDEEAFTEKELLKLCKKKLHLEAAKRFINNTLYDEDDEPIIPLHWAIEHNELELTVSLLALGEDVNQSNDDWSSYPLTVAMQLSDKTIFNLLLLHPEIDVNVSGTSQLPNNDIMQFFGIYDEGRALIPCAILLSADYQSCYSYLDIDWDLRYGRNEELPLMNFFYEKNDLQAMSRLVELGAEVNPEMSLQGGDHETLLLDAIRSYFSPKSDKNTNRLKWFAKYSVILDAEDHEGGALYEYLLREQPVDEQLIEIFKLGKIKAFYDEAEANERSFEITQQEDIKNTLQSTCLFDENQQDYRFDINVSLLSDLIRTRNACFNENVRDVSYIRKNNKHWIAIEYQDKPYPSVIEIGNEILSMMDVYNKAGKIEFAKATPYQIIYLFIKSPSTAYQVIENVANNSDYKVFKKIDNHAIISLDDYYHVYQLVKNGHVHFDRKIESDIKALLNNVYDIYSDLVLNKLLMLDSPKGLFDNNIKINDQPEMAIVKSDCLYDEDNYFYDVIYNHEGKADILYRGRYDDVIPYFFNEIEKSPFFKACDMCGKLGFIPDMAYGETHNECM
ncbi:hypothetical protein [Photobacterium leiognathi]|uniref:hypothetical protein n=1 Tax=Photobacterium leiognathi TaxID=553611 RepID=UPI002980B0DA|nr:hypothetical protein [Photobacterium leiognathi]